MSGETGPEAEVGSEGDGDTETGRHLDEELPPGLEGATPVGQPSGVVGREQALASARDRPLGLFEREKDSPRAHHSPDSATGAGLMTPETPSLPDRTDVYDFLMDTFPARWYDVFLYLGIDRDLLDQHLRDHAARDPYCLYKLIQTWLDRKDPPASWQALADVLRNKLLEGKLAADIEEKYCGAASPKASEKDKSRRDSDDDLGTHLDREHLRFSKVILEVSEALGVQSYAELYHFVTSIRCPDGSRLVDLDSFRERRTADGIFLPLMYTNICSSRDVDFLVHLLESLHRDDLLPLVREFIPKTSVGSSVPHVVFNPNKHFVFKVVLNPAIKHIDLGMVSALKHAVCVGMGIEDQPYLIQFLGWTDKPITLHFQVPMGCMFLVQDCIADVECARDFASNGIIRIDLEINECHFKFDLINPDGAAARLFEGCPVNK